MSKDFITILGPTAVGKTTVACTLAYNFNGEIISADSRQVYKHMDLGTGKDYADYQMNDVTIPYHLIDIMEPTEEYDVFKFRKNFEKAYNLIESNNYLPILAGGTGLYLSSVLQDYKMTEVNFESDRAMQLLDKEVNELITILKSLNPELHNTTDLIKKERIVKAILIAENKSNDNVTGKFPKDALIIGISDDREVIKARIKKRLKTRLKEGMIEEAENLLKLDVTHDKMMFFGLEYKFLSLFLKGELTYNDMYQKLNSAIAAFAKRQMTWFRKMEKEGVEINWIKSGDTETALSLADKHFSRKR